MTFSTARHRRGFGLRALEPFVACVAFANVACGAVVRTDGGRGLLAEHATAPDFSAPDQNGRTRTLREFRGHAVVLFFYPRDGTAGCTREACAFRDAWQRLEQAGGQVVGVSTDDVESHARFATEHGLQFPLLADSSGNILRAYGVGTTLGMASRVTFVIGPDGRVVRVFPDVDPAIHANEVIQVLQTLQHSETAVAPVSAALRVDDRAKVPAGARGRFSLPARPRSDNG